MRAFFMIFFAVIILGVLNYGIYESHQIQQSDEVLLFDLAPVDPRSLMQGDYMVLRYTISRKAGRKNSPRQHIVVKADQNGVAEMVRFGGGSELKSGEKRIPLKRSGLKLPPSFFFQEGHAKHYTNARYGIFKFDDHGNYLLTGLADEDRKPIIVPAE